MDKGSAEKLKTTLVYAKNKAETYLKENLSYKDSKMGKHSLATYHHGLKSMLPSTCWLGDFYHMLMNTSTL